MTPKCILILSSLHFYKPELSSQLGCHHCSKCHLCLAGLGASSLDTFPQVELPPSSVTVQKMAVLFAVPENSWVSKSKAQH